MNNRLKIGQEVLIRGYVDEIRKDTIIIRNDGGYFGTVQEEISVKQEPCEDCISREAVINVLKELMSDWDNDYNVPLIKTRGRVKDLPSVTPTAKYGKALKQTRWIPCSERLPEVNQRVLVTSYSRVCYAMMISADGNSGHPVFKLQDSLNEKVVCETTVHNKFTTSRITAWMPLPESYKAESDEV